ncbi:hypothetical protein [Aquiflexum sp.]|uniref:hypothetical protein n=1 Tax=Aquiflexum sp. TaxID=1872584 RepID=UPI003592FFEB
MAEIKIEKKMPMWPWILLILVVIGILVYLFAFSGDEVDNRQDDRTEQTSEQSSDTRQVAPNNSTVGAYVSFIKEDPDQMGLDHDFTNEALLKLTNATSAMADEIGYDIQKDLEEVRTHTDKITKDPYETTHANSIRKSAEILANVLQNMQQKAFQGLASEANEVKNAATAIDPDVLTLDQKGDVKNFFRESADLLEKMNNNSPQM